MGVSNLSKNVRNVIAAAVVVLIFTVLLIVVFLTFKDRTEKDNAWVFSAASEYSESSGEILDDINSVQFDALMNVKGVGRTAAYEIIRHREKLGGFTSMEQLKDIPCIDGEMYDILCSYFSVQTESAYDSNGEKIDLNTATVRELASVDGISEKTAQNIVLYRKKYGDFVSISELMEVDGIGTELFQKIKDKFTV